MLPPQSQSQTDDEILDQPGAGDDPDAEPLGPVFASGPKEVPEKHKAWFKTLADKFDTDDIATRLAIIRKIRKAREFWKGLQYIYWSERDGVWKSLTSNVGDVTGTDKNPYQYVTNIYQAFGLSFVSVVSQNAPTVRFWPESATNRDDLATADAASKVSEFIARNNDIEQKLAQEAYYLWTDGSFGGYVRFVTDGDKFGSTTQPILEPQEQQIAPAQMKCPCGTSTPTDTEPDPGTMSQPCTNCGAAMGPWNYQPPVTAQVPVQTGTKEVPNGQEVIDIFGMLEIRLPSYCQTLEECPYLVLSVEVPKAKVFNMYPDITPQSITANSASGAIDSQERQARVSLTADSRTLSPNTLGDNLVTYKRIWFRKWSFSALEDKEAVKELEACYPDGAYVAFAGPEVCESRSEKLDDVWVLCAALPGDGIYKPAVGDSLISIQERYNTLANIEVDTHEHGIPTTFAEAESLNFKAWENEGNVPGLTWPIQSRAGLPIQAQLFQTEPAPVSPALQQHRRELMGEVAQFLTGLFPALFGGTMVGNDTASGYAMQRDQAMGRIGLIWRQMKYFHAALMQRAVECFRVNRTDDVEMLVFGDGGQLDSVLIHLDQLKGSFFAHAETNEDFPMSWTQKRNTIQMIMTSPLVATLQTPPNMDAVEKALGPVGLEFPGAAARSKQFREISALLASQPIPVPGQPQVDPQTGQMVPGQPSYQTSVPVDEILDDHITEFATCQEWATSPEGQKAKAENPQGYLNVKLHAQDHMAIVQQQQAAQAVPSSSAPPAKQAQPAPHQAAQAGNTAVQ